MHVGAVATIIDDGPDAMFSSIAVLTSANWCVYNIASPRIEIENSPFGGRLLLDDSETRPQTVDAESARDRRPQEMFS